MPDQKPYAALLAKGEDRRQRILAAAQRLLTRNGGRGTTLGQIAEEAGVSAAGLLHHFESKEQLLHAVLDARDAADLASADISLDLIEALEAVRERFRRSPESVGTFTVLQMENIAPDAPLHDRFLERYRESAKIVASAIQRGQDAGRYRTDIDPFVKATEIIAFLYGIEASWLLDPSIPLAEVLSGYITSLAGQLAWASPAR